MMFGTSLQKTGGPGDKFGQTKRSARREWARRPKGFKEDFDR